MSMYELGDFFLVGIMVVIYIVSDLIGNIVECEFEVMVEELDDLIFYVDMVDYIIVNDMFCVFICVVNFMDVVVFQFILEVLNILLSLIVGIVFDFVFVIMDFVGGIVYELEDVNFGCVLWLDVSSDGVMVFDSFIVFIVKMLIIVDFGECVLLEIIESLLVIEVFIVLDEEVCFIVFGGDICVNNLIDFIGEIFKINDMLIWNVEVMLMGVDSIWLDIIDVVGCYGFIEIVGGEDYNICFVCDFDYVEGLLVIDMIVILCYI